MPPSIEGVGFYCLVRSAVEPGVPEWYVRPNHKKNSQNRAMSAAKSKPAAVRPDADLPATQGLLPRPQLLALLDKAAHYKLTVLQAPAGSGKTTLLSQWVQQRQSGTLLAWLRLEPAHNDPVLFFSHLIAAIRHTLPRFDAYYLNQLVDDLEFSVDAISESLRQGFAAVTDELFVVLDDYQLITAPAIHRTLAEVLLHLPHQVHVVIASRSHPPLQLSRLKLEDELLLLDLHDLRWEPAEIDALSRLLNGTALADEDLHQLAQVTEGWIAGVKLMLLAIARQSRHDLQPLFSGNHPEVFQYLADAVLEQQAPDTRSFLLRTSILETLEADLCNRLLGIRNAQQLLEHLVANRLFVQPLESAKSGWRYHSLFREFLRHRLELEQPEQIDDLHRRAAQWYREHQQFDAALGLLQSIGDTRAMQGLLQYCAEHWIKTGELDRLIEWVGELPDEAIVSHSELAFPFIAGLVFSRRFNQAMYYLAEFRQQCRQHKVPGRYSDADALRFLDCVLEMCQSDTAFLANPLYRQPFDWQSHLDLRLFFQAMRAYHFLLNGQFAQAGVEAQRAKDLLHQAGYEYLSSFADLILVLTERAQGRMLQAVQLAELAYRGRSHVPFTPAWVNAATSIAVIRYEQNRVEDAETMFRDLVPRVSSACATEVISVNYCMLARIRFMQGHEREARRLLDYLARVLQHGSYERFASQITLELTLHSVATRDWATLEKLQRDMALTEKLTSGFWQAGQPYDERRDRLGIAGALILQAQGQAEQAEALLQQLCDMALGNGCVARWAVFRANLAVLYWQQQQESRALSCLQETLRESHLVCFNRTLFDEAPGAAALLQRALATGHIKPLPAIYLHMFGDYLQIATATTQEDPAPSAFKPEPLTDKEREILALLESGASNKEISRRANITLATAKWHLKNIYAKLAVSNRTEAVSRARQYQLL